MLLLMMMMMMMAVMVSAFVELKCIGLGMKWSKSGVGQKPLARPGCTMISTLQQMITTNPIPILTMIIDN